LTVVDARMRRGRSLVYGRWSWERLLAAISKQAIKAEPELYTQEERRARWIGRAPASDQAVSGAQTRLGIHLPDDYLGFVRVSNGCAPTAPTAPRLLPIEEIDRLRNVADPESFAIDKGYPGDDMASVMERCILGSDPEAEEMVLLIPPVQAPEPWQTWFFAHWVPGETRYPSFRHYMEQELQELRAQTDA
jgi:hypothetical protein